ncbi:hypothetical protein COW36_01755 [bacterium (Candidatus Blackallbacteria) CG17_big_fil_post_rev_8_21_14_2_50_48_46]|uniref:Uncharacterized protein n=1 Tax=bacterium (Candidatus Blackallbacteria) CG17_big_fil_post_rev_8_21_14_2_50_48_46 TaxID=2014261 RepID=A0A2M7GAH5_9BACT|nr:MAG: hypothetical protein COW64_26145 [bacterium (Candidatus Blackallbacteria) CG18_big_fil_WC_8_21_14_2_50_49_26]PIW19162.1 MAG: hypothetical protein COW36_01755 [bacterium (Candidatus Blackallbacteria) CG17_big_fil_post_rev_8_21_14_2_50_48_46]PIW45487.1 MAG: hypothetical protein COW20_20385 [bacterium (Candidatus Blackallbacteria) CG13_big_fil_rev_8_21_14_2_50_49_14]
MLEFNDSRYTEDKYNRGRFVAQLPINQQLQHWLQLAESHLLLDQFKPAEKYFRKASKEDPTHLRVLMGLGLLSWKKNRLKEAIQHLEYALKVDSHHVPALILLARIYQQEQAPLRALPLLERAYDYQPENPEMLLCLAEIHLHLQNIEKARFFADLLTRLAPDDLGGWVILQAIAAAQGDILIYTEAGNQMARLDPVHHQLALNEREFSLQWQALQEEGEAHDPLMALAQLSDQELNSAFQKLKEVYHQEI